MIKPSFFFVACPVLSQTRPVLLATKVFLNKRKKRGKQKNDEGKRNCRQYFSFVFLFRSCVKFLWPTLASSFRWASPKIANLFALREEAKRLIFFRCDLKFEEAQLLRRSLKPDPWKKKNITFEDEKNRWPLEDGMQLEEKKK